MKKVGNILWGVVLIILGVIIGLNATGVTNINIFFRGWWTLIIIIPSIIGLIKNDRKLWSFIWLIIGIVLLLCTQNILSFSSSFSYRSPKTISTHRKKSKLEIVSGREKRKKQLSQSSRIKTLLQ